MNMFSKLLSLGFCASLLVTVPVLTRDHDKKHDDHEKCSIVGSYIGTATFNAGATQLVEAQFHEDGTATLFLVSGADSKTTAYVGAWKCGHNCFKFCTASPTGTSTSSHVNGEICFNKDDCRNATGTVIISETTFNLTLKRTDCCQ